LIIAVDSLLGGLIFLLKKNSRQVEIASNS
jgi:hypothetical protein